MRKEHPGDNEVAESLHHAQVALRKSCGEFTNNMKLGGEVEEVSSLEKYKAAISSPGEMSLDIVLHVCLFSSAIQHISSWLSDFRCFCSTF